jgi:hypothetical protein
MDKFEPHQNNRGKHAVESWGADFKDAVFNNEQMEREPKHKRRRAAKKNHWKKSVLRRWLWRLVWLFFLLIAWAITMSLYY